MNFIYKNQYVIEVEIWDTVGLEKFDESYIYTNKYMQGKNGIILVCDGSKYGNIDLKKPGKLVNSDQNLN